MGHWIGNKYKIKLNKESNNYQEIVDSIYNDFRKNQRIYEESRVESWLGNINESLDGVITVSMESYKSAPVTLSSSTEEIIKNNVSKNENESYFYTIDIGENEGFIKSTYGLAKIIAKKLENAGIDTYSIERNEYIEYYIQYPDKLSEINKLAEPNELKAELYDKVSNVNVSFNRCFSANGNKTLNELWLVYFMVYGTKELFYAQTSPVNKNNISLKEILYAEDNDLNPSTWGKNLLKLFMESGVIFQEDSSDISGYLRVGGRLGYKSELVPCEKINEWFQENKADFIKYPQFTEQTLNILKQKYPGTLEKLENITKESYKPKFNH